MVTDIPDGVSLATLQQQILHMAAIIKRMDARIKELEARHE